MHRICMLVVIGLTLVCGRTRAADPKPLEIGKPAPNFELPGVDGKTYRLDDFRDAKILVVVFTCNHCPTAQAYDDRIIQLERDFKNRGVALVAISPNDPHALRLDELGYTEFSDSFDEMKIRAKDRDYKFPYLYDGETQKISKEFGVLATPHVFIFDRDRKLRYQGRIDNSDVHEVTSHEARDAIEALLADKPVSVETTKVFGCSTKWADKQSTAVESLKKWDAEPVTLETIDLAGVQKLAKNAAAADASQTDSGKLLLVNLWATWCGPCVQEMPELVTMNRMYRKRPFDFITISLDEASAKDQVLKALQEAHASGKNYLLTDHDTDKLAAAIDPQMPGPIPCTLLIAPGGKVIYRHSGAIDPVEVKRAIVDYIGRTYAGRMEKQPFFGRHCGVRMLRPVLNVEPRAFKRTRRMPQYSLKSLLLVTTLIGVEAGLPILVTRQRSLAPIEPNLSLFIFVAFGAVVGTVLFARYHRPAFGAAMGAIVQIAILCIKVFVFPNH